MTKHPAARARTFTGIASAAALVAMVAGFELSAQAAELSAANAGGNEKTRTLSPAVPNSGAVPAPTAAGASGGSSSGAAPAAAPAAAAPAAAPAPAPAAPAPAAPAPAPVVKAPAPAPVTPPVATTKPSTKP
jgi:2-oxoglutarate dehydrogenase E2 component (dihydrolipoamide succinyltransferase)